MVNRFVTESDRKLQNYTQYLQFSRSQSRNAHQSPASDNAVRLASGALSLDIPAGQTFIELHTKAV